jgi:hypothetical protein
MVYYQKSIIKLRTITTCIFKVQESNQLEEKVVNKKGKVKRQTNKAENIDVVREL